MRIPVNRVGEPDGNTATTCAEDDAFVRPPGEDDNRSLSAGSHSITV